MAAEDLGNLYNTKMPGYEDPADIQEALRLYHYGSTTYDPNNTDTAQVVANSIAGHFNSLSNSIIELQENGIGSVFSNTEPVSPEDGFIWMNALETGGSEEVYATAQFSNTEPTDGLTTGLLWVQANSSPLTLYVYSGTEWLEIGA
jgi:hypothetical protein